MKKTFKELNKIVPEKEKKEAFRNILKAHVMEIEKNKAKTPFSLLKESIFHYKALAYSLIFFIIFGTFSGAVYASENSLPGDTLYQIKLLKEKTKVALTEDEVKKSVLYLEFAEKRLDEIQKLQEDNTRSEKTIEKTLGIYKDQVSKSEEVLTGSETDKLAKIATTIDNKTSKNQKTLKKISEKNEEAREYIDEAYDLTEKSNDNANLILFEIDKSKKTNTSNTTKNNTEKRQEIKKTQENINEIPEQEIKNNNTKNIKNDTADAMSAGLMQKSEGKIISAENKITEVKKYIDNKEEETNIKEATKKLKEAKELLGEAKDLLENQTYYESFKKSISAQKRAQEAKRIIQERQDEEEDEDDQEKEDNDKRSSSSMKKNIASPIQSINNNKEKRKYEKEEDEDDQAEEKEEDNKRAQKRYGN